MSWGASISAMGQGGIGFTDGPGWVARNFEADDLLDMMRRAAPRSGNNAYLVFAENGGPVGYRSVEHWIRHVTAYSGRFRILSGQAKPFQMAHGLRYMSFTALGLALFFGLGRMSDCFEMSGAKGTVAA